MLYRCIKDTGQEEVEKEVFDYIMQVNQELEKQLSYKVIRQITSPKNIEM